MAQELKLEVFVVAMFIKNRNGAVLSKHKNHSEKTTVTDKSVRLFSKVKIEYKLTASRGNKQPLFITFDNAFTEKFSPW